MFLKKMAPFRPKLRTIDSGIGFYSEENLRQDNWYIDNFNFMVCPLDSDSEQQVVSGYFDEFSFPANLNSPEEIRPGPKPTPEGSQGGYEDDDEDEDGNTDYNSCIDSFSVSAASPLNNLNSSKRVEHKRNSSKQIKGGIVFFTAVTAKLRIPCGVGPDAVIDDAENSIVHIDIGQPTNLFHVIHGNVGPDELALQLKGYDMPKWMQGTQWTRDRYGKCVPAVPQMMQDSLYSKDGLKVEGIFRINADSKDDKKVRKELDGGNFPADVDVHCLAGLIKAWFREHPKGIFDSLKQDMVMHCNTEEDCLEIVSLLPPLESRLLDWALNLMADVVEHEEYNKMNSRSVATVFAPNMRRDSDDLMEDPNLAVKHVFQVINLIKMLVNITVRERSESSSCI